MRPGKSGRASASDDWLALPGLREGQCAICIWLRQSDMRNRFDETIMLNGGRSLKPKRCRICRATFEPFRSTQFACSVPCASAWAEKQKAQQVARANREERKSLAERKAKLKTRQEWIDEARDAVNRVARLRDIYAGHGCISCGARPHARFGGAVDAGHYRSVGSAPHLRFYLPNIHLQCKRCNRDLGSNTVEYRKGLADRIGIERVEEIESMQWTAKWSIEYLKRLKKVMNRKARRLERRIEMKREAA